jgi:hypothetical protein
VAEHNSCRLEIKLINGRGHGAIMDKAGYNTEQGNGGKGIKGYGQGRF